MKRLLSGVVMALLVASIFATALNFQPAKAVAGSQAGSVQVADSVDDWPMFHHDPSHSGFSTLPGPKTNQTLWTSSGATAATVVDGVLYTEGSGDPEGYNYYMYALNISTREQIWNFSYVYMYNYPSYGITSYYSFGGSPAVVDDTVYVVGQHYQYYTYHGGSYEFSSGVVFALNSSTGYIIWQYSDANGAPSSSATVTGGLVYVGSDDRNIYALNATTGALVWTYTTGGGTSCPAVANGIVYAGSADGKLYALNATTGTKIWNYATGGPVSSSPAVAGGVVYVASGDGNVYALNAITDALVWKRPIGAASDPAVANGILYIGSGDDNVYALNAATGTPVWNYKTGAVVKSSPAVASGVVYVGSGDGNVYALDAATGNLVWKYNTTIATVVGVQFSPVVANGVVYVSSPYWLYAFGLSVSVSPPSVDLGFYASQLFASNVSGGVFPYSYQWYLNGNPILGAAGAAWTFAPSSAGSYSVCLEVTGADGDVATSNNATVTVGSPLSVTISPGSEALDVGMNQLFTSVGSGGVFPYSYQWYLNGTPVSDAAGAAWTFAPSSAGSYSVCVEVNDAQGHVATSNNATVTVGGPLSVTISPGSETLDYGQIQWFTSNVSGGVFDRRIGDYYYQWYLNGVPISVASDYQARQPQWCFGSVRVLPAGRYTVFVEVNDSLGKSAVSNIVTVTVLPPLVVSVPSSVHLAPGQSTDNLIAVSVTGGAPPYTYQWHLRNAQGYESVIPGATGPELALPPSSAGSYSVYVWVHDSLSQGLISSYASVTVDYLWNPFRDSYSQENYGSKESEKGNCYGISSTELLYYMHYVLGNTAAPYLPEQVPPASWTCDLTIPVYQDNKGYWQLSPPGLDNGAALAVMFHQCYDPSNFFNPLARHYYNPLGWSDYEKSQYNDLIGSLNQGLPAVLVMHGHDTTGDFYHAVVVYGVKATYNDHVQFEVSDPNSPQTEENDAEYYFSSGSFHYAAAGLTFDSFCTVTGGHLIDTSWCTLWWYIATSPSWWFHNWLTFNVPGYVIVIANHRISVKSNGLQDYFTTRGNSETFVCGIPGSSGIEEGNNQVYAIPKGTSVSVHDPGTDNSSILISSVDNQTGQPVGYGYLLNSTTNQGLLDFNVTLSDSGLLINSAVDGLSLNTTLFYADLQNYSYCQASGISLDAGQTANLTVNNWQALNNTSQSPVTVTISSIPEFPDAIILPLFMIAALLGAATFRMKRRPSR